jgi:hypothetical protein
LLTDLKAGQLPYAALAAAGALALILR